MSETRLTSGYSYVSSSGRVFKVSTEEDGNLVLHYTPDTYAGCKPRVQTVRMLVPEAELLIALIENGLSMSRLQARLDKIETRLKE